MVLTVFVLGNAHGNSGHTTYSPNDFPHANGHLPKCLTMFATYSQAASCFDRLCKQDGHGIRGIEYKIDNYRRLVQCMR
jgi:hypothetical protein